MVDQVAARDAYQRLIAAVEGAVFIVILADPCRRKLDDGGLALKWAKKCAQSLGEFGAFLLVNQVNLVDFQAAGERLAPILSTLKLALLSRSLFALISTWR